MKTDIVMKRRLCLTSKFVRVALSLVVLLCGISVDMHAQRMLAKDRQVTIEAGVPFVDGSSVKGRGIASLEWARFLSQADNIGVVASYVGVGAVSSEGVVPLHQMLLTGFYRMLLYSDEANIVNLFGQIGGEGGYEFSSKSYLSERGLSLKKDPVLVYGLQASINTDLYFANTSALRLRIGTRALFDSHLPIFQPYITTGVVLTL